MVWGTRASPEQFWERLFFFKWGKKEPQPWLCIGHSNYTVDVRARWPSASEGREPPDFGFSSTLLGRHGAEFQQDGGELSLCWVWSDLPVTLPDEWPLLRRPQGQPQPPSNSSMAASPSKTRFCIFWKEKWETSFCISERIMNVGVPALSD